MPTKRPLKNSGYQKDILQPRYSIDVSDETRKMVYDLKDQGVSIRTIAKRAGTSKAIVEKLLRIRNEVKIQINNISQNIHQNQSPKEGIGLEVNSRTLPIIKAMLISYEESRNIADKSIGWLEIILEQQVKRFNRLDKLDKEDSSVESAIEMVGPTCRLVETIIKGIKEQRDITQSKLLMIEKMVGIHSKVLEQGESTIEEVVHHEPEKETVATILQWNRERVKE